MAGEGFRGQAAVQTAAPSVMRAAVRAFNLMACVIGVCFEGAREQEATIPIARISRFAVQRRNTI